MARFTLEEFSDQKPELVYIAGNVVDAEHAEAALDEIHMDYALKVEPYANKSFLGGTYHGVFFYVSEGDASRSRECLHARGFTDTVGQEDRQKD